MAEDSNPLSINPLVQDFYHMAEEYDHIDTGEINPSLKELSKVSQRYQSPELIAEGGIKRIYKVYDARGKRQLALAMLRADVPEDLADPFIHEAWLTARLDHPNIITIHDVGVKAGNRPYFTMDLKQGDTLQELIQKLQAGDRKALSQYPQETLLQIFMKVCDAVSYAHSVHVIHLDLKPANIQIGEYGRVLVCDWGMGRVLGDDDPQELDRMLFNPDLLGSDNLYGQFKGTPGYMAPEQLEKDGRIRESADIYGLGCILYSLLTLLRPLTGDDEEIIKRTKDGAIVPPVKRVPDRNIPMALNAVTMKALATDPAKRYSSVDELRKEVRRYLMGFATEAENASVAKQLNLFYRRNRRFCITILCALLVVTSGTILSFRKLSEKERIATEAFQKAERTLALYEAGQTELETVNAENVDSIIKLSTRYLFAGDKDRSQAILEAALQDYPDNPVLSRALGVLLFCDQRFKAALPWLDRGVHRDDPVCKLARKFADLKSDGLLLTPDSLIASLAELKNLPDRVLAMVLLDQRRRFDLDERARIIEAYLHIINPEWVNGWFEYDEERSSLRVGGAGLKRLSTQHSVLTGLNLRELDISKSEVKDLWKEGSLGVERLDVRDTPMNKIWFLKNMVHLRELVVTPGQLSRNQLNNLPTRVQVIERAFL